MRFTWIAELITGGLCLTMVLLLWVGLRLGARRLARHPGNKVSSSAVETAIFGLLGLMLAFTFYGAASRFDWHRELDIDEANAIGTAYLRIDLLPDETHARLINSFTEYVGARVAFYRTMEDRAGHVAASDRTAALQRSIWEQALAACPADCNPGTRSLVFGSLNEMFDIATKQTLATELHPPRIMYVLLFSLAAVGALITGYALAETGGRSWLHVLAFPLILTVTIYITLNVEYPRRGTIRISQFDQVLENMQREMKAQSARR